MIEEKPIIVLISNEGTKHVFPAEILEFSEWLSALPNPFVPVHLYDLGIDQKTLDHVQVIFNICNYDLPNCKKHRVLNDFAEISKSTGSVLHAFFEGMSNEELLKFTTASTKLGITKLSDLCCFYIAFLLKDYSVDNLLENIAFDGKIDYVALDEWTEVEHPWLIHGNKQLLLDELNRDK